MLRLDETDGTVPVFERGAGHRNGHAVDREGRLIGCEHGGRRVGRTELDGTVTTLGGIVTPPDSLARSRRRSTRVPAPSPEGRRFGA